MIIIAGLLWGVALVITFLRTTIPYAFEAETIIAVSVHEEHQPGRDDAIFVRTDRRTLRVDPHSAGCLHRGETVTKPAWSMTVHRSGGPDCTLGPPRQLAAIAAVPIMITVLTGGVLLLGRRFARPRNDRPKLQPHGLPARR